MDRTLAGSRPGPMPKPRTPTAYDYLLEAIASARSEAELARLRDLGRAHYGGASRQRIDAAAAARLGALAGGAGA